MSPGPDRASKEPAGPGQPVALSRTTWARIALWAAVLGASYALYRHEAALEHFAWHLGYGASAGLLLAAAWLVTRGSHPGPADAWALGGYLYMAIPDVIWLAPVIVGQAAYPHQPWMDLFLGHYSLDLWPLATLALLPAVATSLGTYLWLARRGSHERAGRRS